MRSTMKWMGLIMIMISLAGCKILSVSPDPGRTITLEPGQKQKLSLTSIGGPLINHRWIDITTESFTVEDVKSVLGTMLSTSWTFAPGQEDIGRHTIRCEAWDTEMYTTTWEDERTWEVVVKGVIFTPTYTNITVVPGQVQEYQAAAYPEGSYAYHWELDGVPVGESAAYAFTPTTVQIGGHTLTVTAVGEGNTYTYSRHIYVPFATLTDMTIHDVRPTLAGGYVVAGVIYNGTDKKDEAKIVTVDAQGAVVWDKTYGGSGYDGLSTIQPTADGGFIAVGCSDSNDIPGQTCHGGYDYYVLRIDGQGNVLWQRLFGGSGEDGPAFVQPTADGGFLVAGTSESSDISGVSNHGLSDGYVIKLDAQGEMLWQQMYGGDAYDVIRYATTTADGGLILAGYVGNYKGSLGNSSKSDCLVIKIDALGGLVWEKTYGGLGIEEAFSIEPSADGGYVMTVRSGPFLNNTALGPYVRKIMKIDENGTDLWQRVIMEDTDSYDMFDMQAIPVEDGYALVTSMDDATISGVYDPWSPDAYVIKLNLEGVVQWQALYGTRKYEYAGPILATSDGGYLVGVSSHQGEHPTFTLLKLDAQGT